MSDRWSIDKAEQVIKTVGNKISYTKLRDFLTMINSLQSQLKHGDQEFNEKERDQIDRFIIQLIYESGRKDEVRDFVKNAGLIESLKEMNTTAEFQKFHQYLEALVAYHKFYV